ncbi:MAG TPA: hypothetical protein VH394_15325, partial [Thermoanaerobaculia bacterium]|nr:hypothetical protein [Thermoanaerobaculia bacterium]
MEPNDVKPEWGAGKRMLFRYLFSYLVLFNFPFPLYYIPYAMKPLGPVFNLWEKGILWMGRLVFGHEVIQHPSGSGDTAHDWADFFFRLLLAAAITLVWSLLDRKRPD